MLAPSVVQYSQVTLQIFLPSLLIVSCIVNFASLCLWRFWCFRILFMTDIWQSLPLACGTCGSFHLEHKIRSWVLKIKKHSEEKMNTGGIHSQWIKFMKLYDQWKAMPYNYKIFCTSNLAICLSANHYSLCLFLSSKWLIPQKARVDVIYDNVLSCAEHVLLGMST